jgi:hypothetical protein
VAYSDTGVPLWTNYYNGPANGDDFPHAIAVDDTGTVFVTGYSRGAGTSNDYATVAYSGAGMPLWTNRLNGAANNDDRAVAIGVDRAGNVFVTGYSWASGGHDFATIKYSSSLPLPRLDFQRLDNQLILAWTNTDCTLQATLAIDGTFTNIVGAASPFTNSVADPQIFFRLLRN